MYTQILRETGVFIQIFCYTNDFDITFRLCFLVSLSANSVLFTSGQQYKYQFIALTRDKLVPQWARKERHWDEEIFTFILQIFCYSIDFDEIFRICSLVFIGSIYGTFTFWHFRDVGRCMTCSMVAERQIGLYTQSNYVQVFMFSVYYFVIPF